MVIATRLVYRRPLLRPTSPPQNAISTLFLQLPPTYRSFHATPKPQFYNAALNATHTVLETIHSTTGLPWVYTLPLAGLLIRTTLVLPISIYNRRSMRKQAALSPLISAWHHVFRRETMAEVGHLGPTVAQSTTMSKIREKRVEIYKRFGCPLWHNYVIPVIQLPVWLLTIETIRKMCGAQVGLLGMVMNRTPGIEGDGTEQVATEQVATVLKELTFATEGALWFPDLLLPDPQLILPFMLSGAMLLNLSNAVGPNAAVWQRRLTTSLRIVALAIGPLTLHVPSAMLVYWISSSTLAYTQARLLDIFMPVKLPVQPCKPRQPRGLDVQKPEAVQ